MECLICFESIESHLQFFDIICFSNEKGNACQTCFEQFHTISEEHCPSCYKEGYQEECEDCQRWKTKGYQVTHQAKYKYNLAMKEFMSIYKFQGDYLLSEVFSNDIRDMLSAYKDFMIIPVPSSPKSMQERGFNQVTALLDKAGVKYHDILEREDGKKQSQNNKGQRLEREQMFRLKRDVLISEKVLIVDDIYTTGATLKLIYDLFSGRENLIFKTLSLAR